MMPARQLVRALTPTRAPGKWLVMYKLIGDVSGKGNMPVMAAAAYFAEDVAWDAFEAEWSIALREAGVSAFHAADFFGCYGEFAAWTRGSKQHRHFARRFAAIAESKLGAGFVSGVDPLAFDRLWKEHLAPLPYAQLAPHRRFTPLMMVCLALLQTVASKYDGSPGGCVVLFENEAGIGEFIEYFNWSKRSSQKLTVPFATLAPCEKSFLPSQAADLLAYESSKLMAEYLGIGRDSRPVKSLARLQRRSRIDVRVMTPALMEELIPAVKAFMGRPAD